MIPDSAHVAPDITIENVTFGYNGGVTLRDVSFTAPGGQATVILGRSGVGKSTLLRLIVGLAHPQSGRITVGGQDVTNLAPKDLQALRRRVGLCFQSGALLNSMSVGENIAFPLQRAGGRPRAEIAARTEECLEIVGLGGRGDLMPSALSGGMRKRVGFARALALDPDILLFDEPTTGLDPVLAATIREYVMKLKDSHRTFIIVSHDLSIAFHVADYMVMLHDGQVLAQGVPADLRANPDPTVQQFLEGRPDS